RERCVNCRWKCICGKVFPTKRAFSNHLKKSSEIQPSSKKGSHLLDEEFIHSCFSHKCSDNCLQYWTPFEIKSYVRKIACLSQTDLQKKIIELLQLFKESDGRHVLGDSRFSFKLQGK